MQGVSELKNLFPAGKKAGWVFTPVDPGALRFTRGAGSPWGVQTQENPCTSLYDAEMQERAD